MAQQNVMTGFMQGYQWADDMQRRQLQDERQAKLDTQAQQDRTRRIGMEDEVLGRQRKEWDDKDKIRDFSQLLYKVEEGGIGALSDDDLELARSVTDPLMGNTLNRLTKTPDDAKAALGHIDQVFSAMSGQGGDYRGAIDSANVLLADYINQGQGGTEKRIKDVLPSQGGRGFYLDLEMKDEKGNFKTAPMTKGRGTADTDPVSEVDGAEMMQALGLLKKSIEARLVELGDNSPLERKREKEKAKAEVAAEERKFKRELGMEEFKAGLKAPDLKIFGGAKEGHYALDPRTGQVRQLRGGMGWAGGEGGVGGSGSGRSGGARLKVTKEDQSLFDDQLRKQFIAEYMDGVKSLPESERAAYAEIFQTDDMGSARVDMDRVFAKMPPEMRARFNAARQQGEMFMGDGSLSPVLAANQAYRSSQNQGQGGQDQPVHPLAEVDPKDKAQVDEAMQMISKMTMEDLDASLQELSDPNNPVFNPGLVKEIAARLSKKQEKTQPPPRSMDPRTNVFPYQPGASTKTKASFSFDNPFKSNTNGDVAFAEKQVATLVQQIEGGRLSAAQVADSKQKLAWWQDRLTKLSR